MKKTTKVFTGSLLALAGAATVGGGSVYIANRYINTDETTIDQIQHDYTMEHVNRSLDVVHDSLSQMSTTLDSTVSLPDLSTWKTQMTDHVSTSDESLKEVIIDQLTTHLDAIRDDLDSTKTSLIDSEGARIALSSTIDDILIELQKVSEGKLGYEELEYLEGLIKDKVSNSEFKTLVDRLDGTDLNVADLGLKIAEVNNTLSDIKGELITLNTHRFELETKLHSLESAQPALSDDIKLVEDGIESIHSELDSIRTLAQISTDEIKLIVDGALEKLDSTTRSVTQLYSKVDMSDQATALAFKEVTDYMETYRVETSTLTNKYIDIETDIEGIKSDRTLYTMVEEIENSLTEVYTSVQSYGNSNADELTAIWVTLNDLGVKFRAHTTQSYDDVDAIKKEVSEIKTSLDLTNGLLDVSESKLTALETSIKDAHDKLLVHKDELESLMNKIEEIIEPTMDVASEITELTSRVDKNTADLLNLKDDIDSLRREMSNVDYSNDHSNIYEDTDWGNNTSTFVVGNMDFSIPRKLYLGHSLRDIYKITVGVAGSYTSGTLQADIDLPRNWEIGKQYFTTIKVMDQSTVKRLNIGIKFISDGVIEFKHYNNIYSYSILVPSLSGGVYIKNTSYSSVGVRAYVMSSLTFHKRGIT